MTTTLESLLSQGIKFLDDIDPAWPNLINLDTLDLRDPQLCVIGQTFCHKLFRDKAGVSDTWPTAWTAGQWALADRVDREASGAGFDTYNDGLLEVLYEDLQEAWTEIVRERQQQQG